jgi:hypothetical protein
MRGNPLCKTRFAGHKYDYAHINPPLVRDHLFLRQPFTCPQGWSTESGTIHYSYVNSLVMAIHNTFTYVCRTTRSQQYLLHTVKNTHTQDWSTYMRCSLLQRFLAQRSTQECVRMYRVCLFFTVYVRL